jgi:hypothetical protein
MNKKSFLVIFIILNTLTVRLISQELKSKITDVLVDTCCVKFNLNVTNQGKHNVYFYTPSDKYDFCALIIQISVIRNSKEYFYEECNSNIQLDQLDSNKIVLIKKNKTIQLKYKLEHKYLKGLGVINKGDIVKINIDWSGFKNYENIASKKNLTVRDTIRKIRRITIR